MGSKCGFKASLLLSFTDVSEKKINNPGIHSFLCFYFKILRSFVFSYCLLIPLALFASNNVLISLDIDTPTLNTFLLSKDPVQRSILWLKCSSLLHCNGINFLTQRQHYTLIFCLFDWVFQFRLFQKPKPGRLWPLSLFFSTFALRQIIQLPLLSYKTQPEQGDGCVNVQSSESGLQRAHLRGAPRVVSAAQSI